MLKGIAASAGYAIAKVYKLEQPVVTIEKKEGVNPTAEINKFNAALEKTKADIEAIKAQAEGKLSDEELAVFDAHLMMASDPDFAGQIVAMIENDRVNAEYAADVVAGNTVAMFEAMDNDYFRERAADVKDVTFRLKCNLLGVLIPNLSLVDEDSVIVAHDLTPSDTAQLNKYAKGFATAIGGRTSHSAIMARSLEVPAVVGCAGVLEACKHGDLIILDAVNGEVIVNPDEATVKEYEEKLQAFKEEKEALKVLLHAKSVTLDGHQVELAGNIGTPKDVEVAKDLAKIADVNYEKYGLEMLKAGTDLSDFTPAELINIDSKPFVTNGIKYQVAQVNTADINEVLKNKKEIETAMESFIKENNEHFFLLLITDILENNSQIIAVGEKASIVEKAFGINLEENMAFLPGVVSRKKQVVPVIEKNI